MSPPRSTTRFYKIRPRRAEVQALISTLIQTDQSHPLTLGAGLCPGRRPLIRDPPENLTKIEELLLDRSSSEADQRELQIANYSLVPRDVDRSRPTTITDMTGRIIEAIETFLYAKKARRRPRPKAAASGSTHRRSSSPSSITDPNPTQVRKYLDSLPELRKGAQQASCLSSMPRPHRWLPAWSAS